MASSSPTGPDTLINLKVSHDGAVKKLKLPLRDMGASTLVSKLREQLRITAIDTCLFERYSDSAASYVVLDPTNTAVYKQLYRAAKAKGKLKLRITTLKPSEAEEPKVAPRPVTVEDVPEANEIKATAEHIEDVAAPSASSFDPAAVDAAFAATFDSIPVEHGVTVAFRRRPDIRDPTERGGAERKLIASVTKARDLLERLDLISKQQTEQAAAKQADPQPSAPTPVPAAAPSESAAEAPRPSVERQVPAPRPPFAVFCNSCDKTIPDIHYHCSTCDGGDFDLCQTCVDCGISCYGDDHWLIKRLVRGGVIVTSTTERKAPKSLAQAQASIHTRLADSGGISAPAGASAEPQPSNSRVVPVFLNYGFQNVRTCNNCIQELPEHEFLHCTTCFDFDLCKSCFLKDSHGHHPKHAFVPAAEGTAVDRDVYCRLAPGRNQKHNAICDGCDKFIRGIRHKCLDCPDWDYCSDCIVNASFVHPNHRFVPVYDALRDNTMQIVTRPVHLGIHCDGPLCKAGRPRFISGDRYKCAVCHDTDFCANCEASPANTHNKTHPLLKFKTPVRNVNIVTTGEHEDGKKMPLMGDRARPIRCPRTNSRATSTTSIKQTIAPSSVQTVVDLHPGVPAVCPAGVCPHASLFKPKAEAEAEKQKPAVESEKPVVKVEEAATVNAAPAEELVAVYECDTVVDGTIMPPNHIFEQTWVLHNAGTEAWPAGCSVKFVGGDYMGHVDSKHPAGVQELISTFESTICYRPLAPGQSFPFTVLLRTPPRPGKVISYWRLTTRDGLKFGHRLWCDVEVKPSLPQTPEEDSKATQAPLQPLVEAEPAAIEEKVKEEPSEEPNEEPKDEEEEVESRSAKTEESQMIFPKLEKESPVASIHQDAPASEVASKPAKAVAEDFEDCTEDDEWDEDGFMTDEEYDILDASDEEYLEEDEQKKQQLKK